MIKFISGQHLAGQTWQAWAQPQNSYLSGQTWQPWAQPQNTYLAGQTWQPWAREAAASTSKENENVGAPARLQEFNPDDLLKVRNFISHHLQYLHQEILN